MKATLFGILLGGLIGYAVTKIEHQSTETIHALIGTTAGAVLGGLAIHHLSPDRRSA